MSFRDVAVFFLTTLERRKKILNRGKDRRIPKYILPELISKCMDLECIANSDK
jgi:hypothetical protein